MATANARNRQKRRSRLSIALVLVLALLAGWWAFGAAITGYATVGTAYGAETACACRYIGGRSLSSCKSDFEPGMEAVFLHQNEQQRSVTAFVPLISSDTARFRPGFGCILDRWKS